MTPEQYLDRYHNLSVILDDNSTQTVHLSNYVSGCVPPYWPARGHILDGIARELNRTAVAGQPPVRASHLPAAFVIDNWMIDLMGVLRVFMGKGSPDEIADVLWLAHRFGLVTNPARPRANAVALDEYVRRYIGLDCNSFVGNYYGLNPETAIPAYSSHGRRRTDVHDLASGDVLVSVVTAGGAQEHIALVGRVESFGPPARFNVVEWGSAGQSSHVRQVERRFHTDDGGAIYTDYVSQAAAHDGERGRKYVYSPPCTPSHRGYQIQALSSPVRRTGHR